MLTSYNKTMNTKTETNDTADITAQVAVGWDATFNFTFEDITAQRVILDIETNETGGDDGTDPLTAAMSFKVTNSCYLYSAMFKLRADPPSDLVSGDDIVVRIYNATESAGKPMPNCSISSAVFIDLGDPPSGFDGWANATWSSPAYLNTSNTFDNYFFVWIAPIPPARVDWKFRLDSSTGDDGYAWYNQAVVGWTEHQGIDYYLNVSLLPSTFYPAPSQVGMKVNGTIVEDSAGNAGWWNTTFTAGTSPAYFNVTTNWPIVFNYTYNATFARLFPASTIFSVNGSGAHWNITAPVTFPAIGANMNSRSLNFTLPSHWTVDSLYNGSTLIPPANYTVQDGGAGPGWLFIDEPHGAGNGTSWLVACSDYNYLQNVYIYWDSVEVSGQEVNITDTLQVNASLRTDYTDGVGRLTLYDPANTSLVEWAKSPSNFWLNFSPFTPDTYTGQNGRLTCEVVWNNSYHAGVGSSHVWLIYPTEVLPEQAVQIEYVGDLAVLRVYYNDTFNNQHITGAQVNVTIDGATHPMTDQNDGWYEYTWDTTGKANADYTAHFSANKTGYSLATATSTVSLYSRASLSLSWDDETVYYNHSIELRVNYTRLTGGSGGIVGATVNITVGASTYNLLDLGNGTYRVLLNGTEVDLGFWSFTVRAQGSRCEPKQDTGNLTVVEEPTHHTGSTPTSVDGGKAFNITLTYQADLGGGIEGATTFSCLLNGTVFTDFTVHDLGGGYYNFTFTLNVTETVTFNITLTIVKHGFEAQTYQAYPQVRAKPTNLELTFTPSNTVVYGENFTLRIHYTDSLGGGMVGALVMGNWTGLEVTDHLNGTYTIQCRTTGLDAGWWRITFNASIMNYQIQWFSWKFHVLWPTTLNPKDGVYTVEEYENETVVIEVAYMDTHNGVGVSAGTIWLLFQGTTHYFTHIGGGWYRLALNLTGVTPSTYTVEVFAEGEDYQARQIAMELEVLAKARATLTVELPDTAVEGDTIAIMMRLSFLNGTPITSETVTVTVWLRYVNGTLRLLIARNVTTDGQGEAAIAVAIPVHPSTFWERNNGHPVLVVEAVFWGTRPIASASMESSITVEQMPSTTPPLLWLLLVLVALIIAIAALAIWLAYSRLRQRQIRLRREREEKLQREAEERLREAKEKGGEWAKRLIALNELRHLIVMHRTAAVSLFTYNFTQEELSSTLVSGFLSAVGAFYRELSGEEEREAALQDIHYEDLHLSLHEGRYVTSVLISEASAGKEVRASLAEFTARFEERYSDELEGFDGRVDIFADAGDLVKEAFHTELLLPHECVNPPVLDAPSLAQKVYNLAEDMQAKHGSVYLPKLFLKALELFEKEGDKYAIAASLSFLCENGCIMPREAKD